MLDTLPSLQTVMQKYGLEPKKSLGQNFLLDANITDRIAAAAGNLSDIHVIEIGPGPGGLTRSLLQAGAKSVMAVEKDARCVEALHELAEHTEGRLQIVEADALEVSLDTLTDAPRMVVANLPYNIATPLLLGWLQALADNRDAFCGLVLMFQKEVAMRIIAQAGDKHYGRLAVMAQWQCEVAHGFDLPPEVFTPPPKVTSSVVHLKPRSTPLAELPFAVMEKIVAKAFSQRRKMIRACLKGLDVPAEALLEAAGVDPTLRTEQLSLEGIFSLAQAYDRLRSSSAER